MHILVNDKVNPWRYFTGDGFTDSDTTVEETGAKRFLSLTAATDVLAMRSDKGQLYAQGWRVVPASYRPERHGDS